MGTPIAPTIANIFMAELENEFIAKNNYKPSLYKRYIDDIFFIWENDQESLNDFMQKINEQHPSIKYTFTQSFSSVDFLDLTIFKGDNFSFNGILSTKTFKKKTNTFQYIHKYSQHAPHIKKSIIKSECLRYLRQCTNKIDFEKYKTDLIQHFLDRGYKKIFILKCIKDIKFENKANLIKFKIKKRYIIPFIIPYDFRRKNPKHKITKHWKDLYCDPEHKFTFDQPPIICFNNKKNIGQIITKTALTNDIINLDIPNSQRNYHIPKLITPCLKNNCYTCQVLYNKNSFICNSTKQKHYIRNRFSCDSRNLIYVIQCNICQVQYVGQTSTPIRARLRHHRNKFNAKNVTPRQHIYIHFDKHHHFNFTFIPIETVPPDQLRIQYLLHYILPI